MQRFFTRPRLALVLWLLLLCQAAANPVDSGERARAIIRELHGSAHRAIAKDPIERAKDVLERARAAAREQDDARARLLDDFALEWAETARDLLQVDELERRARALEDKVAQSETNLKRARALLEETEMRRGRAHTELLRLEPEAAASPPTPSTTATAQAPSAGANP